jgi:capsid assembly protease
MDSLILSWITNECWAVDSAFGERAMQFLLHRAGYAVDRPDPYHAYGAARSDSNGVAPVHGAGVTIIPLQGVISHRISGVSGASQPQGASSEQVGVWFDCAMNNPDIGTIVLDINSPGGAVAGTPELTNKIHAARGSKRVIAVANANAASAAYWIGSAASEFYVTPSGRLGSIGVLAIHQDISQKLANEGVKTSFIYAGERKVMGNAAEPLPDEARALMQAEIDGLYGAFVDAVARNRGVGSALVKQEFGKGGMMNAQDAFTAGMVDGILSLDQVIASLKPTSAPRRNHRAAHRAVDIQKRKNLLNIVTV